MDYEIFWERLGVRKPDLTITTLCLAIFAVEYVEVDSKLITDYSLFNNKYGA